MQAGFVMTTAVWECDKTLHCTEYRNFIVVCSKVVLEMAGGRSCCIVLSKKGIFSFVIGQVSNNFDCLALKIKAPSLFETGNILWHMTSQTTHFLNTLLTDRPLLI
jgi:hypothetical protein